MTEAPVQPLLRRTLDGLYDASGIAAAICLAGICVLMLAQALAREAGYLLRGADDISAWLCAASAFLALAHTFRKGELIRVGLWVERLNPPARRRAEIVALSAAALCTGYMAWAIARFVFESWKFNEVAQGLIKIPIWIPQLSLVLGALILWIAVIDELVTVVRGAKPAYQVAEETRRNAGDFSEML
ncbi:MAG TPA: TRAP transporter small permease [Burkholderiales bacterium]|nr:TRAP transporter small permease [Burkholderiales bacterium]